ncbi:helix-turn-helix domain-containing protein [Sneathiella chungangensis]|uniref:Shikimate kinase n=1 Tax=Sneathiella chungangensis TaxID=1418234 RepID=A0A845MH35_9PROT|nr:helix-turn-helix transcriptional regulator [Sneathiella chungangensis]MZR23011.1 helix-turn-helix domain-containing protein [Sneathiella chungangensis]
MSKVSLESSRRESGQAGDFLSELGAHVRAARAKRGMTRRILARDSGVSERYLAKLESGEGNASMLVLRQIAAAMDMTLIDLVAVGDQLSPEMRGLYQLAKRLPSDQLAIAIGVIRERLAKSEDAAKGRRIALIGLRGAGKSTLGARLAEKLGYGFIELNKRIEKEFGAGLDEIFSLAGQPSFRRLEHRCLTDIVTNQDEVVIATGGSIVADEQTFSLLLRRTHVIWLCARPEEHMSRVVAQGDMRPMVGNREAMADLKQILSARTPLYSRADATCNTSGRTVEESLEDLRQVVGGLLKLNERQTA